MKNVFGKLNTLKDTLLAYEWWARVAISSKVGNPNQTRSFRNRHMALLACWFPPDVSGGVYRPVALVKYGTQLRWKISVISIPSALVANPSPSGSYLLQTLPESVCISSIEPPKLRPSWNWFPGIDGGFLNALATFSLARQLFENDPPSVVMASGPPFHNFVAAYYITQYYRSKLVLDYRDEWTEGTRAFVRLGKRVKF